MQFFLRRHWAMVLDPYPDDDETHDDYGESIDGVTLISEYTHYKRQNARLRPFYCLKTNSIGGVGFLTFSCPDGSPDDSYLPLKNWDREPSSVRNDSHANVVFVQGEHRVKVDEYICLDLETLPWITPMEPRSGRVHQVSMKLLEDGASSFLVKHSRRWQGLEMDDDVRKQVEEQAKEILGIWAKGSATYSGGSNLYHCSATVLDRDREARKAVGSWCELSNERRSEVLNKLGRALPLVQTRVRRKTFVHSETVPPPTSAPKLNLKEQQRDTEAHQSIKRAY